ncbi:MAG: pilus assembly protein TadE [Maritimibacter sp.]|nr:pilus assembly protein TadE [Maritimibacter sp.]
MKRRLTQHLRRFRRSEDGAAMTIEFLILFPLFIAILVATFEVGMVNARHALLERGVDLAVRDLRLGRDPTPTYEELRWAICQYSGVIGDCDASLFVELERVSTADFDFRTGLIACTDQSEEIDLVEGFNPGTLNDLMVITVCGKFPVMRPLSFIGRYLPKLGDELHYRLVAMSAFVNEP